MACIAYYRNGFPQYKEGDENRVFGKDAKKVLKICRILMDRFMYNTDRPSHPGLKWIMQTWKDKKMTLRDARTQWNNDHPDEFAQYREACERWENDNKKLLVKLYGIAKQHHVRVDWLAHGSVVCLPDQFLIYKNGERIAIIQL